MKRDRHAYMLRDTCSVLVPLSYGIIGVCALQGHGCMGVHNRRVCSLGH